MFNKWRQIRSKPFVILADCSCSVSNARTHLHVQHNPTCRNTFHCMCTHTHTHTCTRTMQTRPHTTQSNMQKHLPKITRQNFTLACLQKTLQPTWNWFQFHKHNIVELWMSFHWTAKNAIPSRTQFAKYNPLKMGRSCKSYMVSLIYHFPVDTVLSTPALTH